jgi:hypothetical protein
MQQHCGHQWTEIDNWIIIDQMASENSKDFLEVILYPGNQKTINKSSLFRNNSGTSWPYDNKSNNMQLFKKNWRNLASHVSQIQKKLISEKFLSIEWNKCQISTCERGETSSVSSLLHLGWIYESSIVFLGCCMFCHFDTFCSVCNMSAVVKHVYTFWTTRFFCV